MWIGIILTGVIPVELSYLENLKMLSLKGNLLNRPDPSRAG